MAINNDNEIKTVDALTVQGNMAQQMNVMVFNAAIATIRQLEERVKLLSENVALLEEKTKQQAETITSLTITTLETEPEGCE